MAKSTEGQRRIRQRGRGCRARLLQRSASSTGRLRGVLAHSPPDRLSTKVGRNPAQGAIPERPDWHECRKRRGFSQRPPAHGTPNVGRTQIQNFAEAFVRAADSPTKPRRGHHPPILFNQDRAAVQANPFALRIQFIGRKSKCISFTNLHVRRMQRSGRRSQAGKQDTGCKTLSLLDVLACPRSVPANVSCAQGRCQPA